MGAAGKLQKTDLRKVLAIQPLIREKILIAEGSVENNFPFTNCQLFYTDAIHKLFFWKWNFVSKLQPYVVQGRRLTYHIAQTFFGFPKTKYTFSWCMERIQVFFCEIAIQTGEVMLPGLDRDE